MMIAIAMKIEAMKIATATFPRLSSSGKLTWGVSRYALEIPWRVFVGEHIGGVVLTAILVALIGVLSSLDVLRNKPLATLRAE